MFFSEILMFPKPQIHPYLYRNPGPCFFLITHTHSKTEEIRTPAVILWLEISGLLISRCLSFSCQAFTERKENICWTFTKDIKLNKTNPILKTCTQSTEFSLMKGMSGKTSEGSRGPLGSAQLRAGHELLWCWASQETAEAAPFLNSTPVYPFSASRIWKLSLLSFFFFLSF